MVDSKLCGFVVYIFLRFLDENSVISFVVEKDHRVTLILCFNVKFCFLIHSCRYLLLLLLVWSRTVLSCYLVLTFHSVMNV